MTIRTRRRLLPWTIASSAALLAAAYALDASGHPLRAVLALGLAAIPAWISVEVSPTDADVDAWRAAR